MILDLGELRLPVPVSCQEPWMRWHTTSRCPNIFWHHCDVSAEVLGPVHVTGRDSRWSVSGRGARIVFDSQRQRLLTSFPRSFWIRHTLRMIDLASRVSRGQLACHTSVIFKRNKLWLLAGRSGAGKTTASQLAQARGWKVLQDDLAFLKEGNYLSTINWSDPDQFVAQTQIPVSGICLLEQSQTDDLSELDLSDALKKLGPIWGPIFGSSPELWLEVLGRELKKIPLYRLRFRKDPSFVKLLGDP